MNMAKRKYTKMRKIEPSVQTLIISTPTVSSGTTDQFFCDLSQIASLVNRRFYRQGINWAVAGIKILSQSSMEGSVAVSKLPNTWIMSNSWEKGFRAWQKMNDIALQESSSVKPKFLDFKIYADLQHHRDGFAANLLPVTLGGTFTPGEWEPSKFVIPKTNGTDDTISHEIIAVGANYPGTGGSGLNAVSLIEGYAASRGLPDVLDPNTPDDAALANGSTPQNYLGALFNEGTDQTSDVIDDLITENNIAPYPFENGGIDPATGLPWADTMYPNGANQGFGLQIHDIDFISPTTIGGTTHIKGGSFPCGLIRFDVENSSSVTQNLTIVIDLLPGNHRGYLCEPMTEM